MNITPQSNNHLPIQTAVNLQTDSLRRENQQREIITKPEASSQSAAEKGVASDKERGRTPAQNNEHVDFASLRKQAELANDVIGDDSKNKDKEQGASENSQEQNSESPANEIKTQGEASKTEKSSAEVAAEKQIIRSLASRDKEVRSHESAHASVGGVIAGAPSYTYEIGPDGKKYAVEGEVSVDVTPVPGDPKETIAKMNRVQAAALAPTNPSAQDVRVAATAAAIILEAQAEVVNSSTEDDETKRPDNNLYRDKETLEKDGIQSTSHSQAFDRKMAQTIAAQDAIAPTRSLAIDERAGRIAQFYSTINQAYEKPANNQFELTA